MPAAHNAAPEGKTFKGYLSLELQEQLNTLIDGLKTISLHDTRNPF